MNQPEQDPGGQPQQPAHAPATPQPTTPPPATGPGGPETPVPAPAPPAPGSTIPGAEKKLVAGLLGILLGGFGVHKFYLGYTQEGAIMLAVTLVVGFGLTAITCGLTTPAAFAMPIIGIIEGIMYLTKSDDEFVATYVTGRKPWF